MTKQDFIWICNQHNILPSVAMEDDTVRVIIKKNMNSVAKQIALNTYLKNYF